MASVQGAAIQQWHPRLPQLPAFFTPRLLRGRSSAQGPVLELGCQVFFVKAFMLEISSGAT